VGRSPLGDVLAMAVTLLFAIAYLAMAVTLLFAIAYLAIALFAFTYLFK
jgi:hypothetical protein